MEEYNHITNKRKDISETTPSGNYFSVGDIVDMHCGEQGIVVEILDDDWVLLLQCNGHVEKAFVPDIWHTDTVQNGKAALDELFMKTLGYSGMDEDKTFSGAELSDEDFFDIELSDEDIPF